MDDKKIFRLDMSIAVEATDADEAFEVLVTEETLNQIKNMILNSKEGITEMFADEQKTAVIN